MAASGCSPVEFVGSCANNFYFQVAAATDVEGDSFTVTNRLFNYWVRSKANKYLLFNENKFQVQNLNSSQLSRPDCNFKIQTYKDIPGGEGRTAAMLYVKVKGKTMVACCSQQHDIYPEEMTLPSQITGNTHKAVFYMTKLTGSNTYTFESSEYPSRFLGFESGGDEPSLQKLILRHKG